MKSNRTSCSRCVGLEKPCPYCNGKQIKHGVTKAGKMRLKCTCCNKTQVKSYTYTAYSGHINLDIVELTKEGSGTRSTTKFLQILPTTVIKRILSIANMIKQPVI